EYADQPAPVDFDNYYGLTKRDYEKTRTHMLTFALEHDLTDTVRISNTTRYGYATRDSIYSAPRFAGDTTLVNPQTQSRDTVDEVLFNQSNLFAEFNTGVLRHDLFDPNPRRPWIGTIVDTPGGPVRASADTLAAYLFDTVHLSEQLLLTGGVRWERYEATFTPVAPATERARTDETVTWRAGVTF